MNTVLTIKQNAVFSGLFSLRAVTSALSHLQQSTVSDKRAVQVKSKILLLGLSELDGPTWNLSSPLCSGSMCVFYDNDHKSEQSPLLCLYRTLPNKLEVVQMSARSNLQQPRFHCGWRPAMQPWTIHRQFRVCAAFNKLLIILKQTQTWRRPQGTIEASSSDLLNIVTREETFPSSDPARPPAWRICTENIFIIVKQSQIYQIASEPSDYLF